MKGHKVGIQIAMRAMAHVTLRGWASEKSLSEVIPCSDRTAARIIAYLKSEGWVVKSGYGVIPAAKHSAANTSNGGSGKDSATNIPPPQIPVLLNKKECPEIAIANRQPADSLLVVKSEHQGTESRAVAGSFSEEDPDAAPTLSLGPPNEVATHQDADDEQPSGIVMDKEQAEAVEDYEAWRDNRKPLSEITGARATRAYSQDENVAAYQEDLDKLVGVISREVDARKLANRKLGEQRKNRKITAGALHSGKKEWRQLRDIAVELTGDRASGELRYANLAAAGQRLDLCMAGWREKMAMDPGLIRHYQELIDRQMEEARAERREERRHAIHEAKAETPDEAAGGRPSQSTRKNNSRGSRNPSPCRRHRSASAP